jgi:beta-glucosidase
VAGDGATRSTLSDALGNAGALSVTAVDHAAQEDARLATWSGAGAATLALQGASPIDLQREANGQLSLAFNYRVDSAPSAPVQLAVECGANCGGQYEITEHLRKATKGEWQQLKILLQCFQKAGADMRSVTAPFAVTTAGELTLAVANVRLETGVSDAIVCQ